MKGENNKPFSFIIDSIAVLGMGYIGISLLYFIGTIIFDEPKPARVNPFSKIEYSSELERKINIISADEKMKISCIDCDC